MVQLDVIRACGNALVKKQPVTAVFVGGTSGIGEYALRALASTHGSSGQGLRVYLVGRNETAAKTIMADCRKECPAGEFHFVRASDLASLREVDRVCKEILSTEEASAAGRKPACVDLLVLSQAYFAFGGKLERQGMTPAHISPYHFVADLTGRDQRRPRQVTSSALLLTHALRHPASPSAPCFSASGACCLCLWSWA
jgi:NAD(P)-dependent dehydrogenase (short-subunit alcohol dehydrogenase family)